MTSGPTSADAEARGKKLRCAVLQLSSQQDVKENLRDCAEQVRLAAQAGARLVLLPENFAYFGPEAGRRAVAEPFGAGGTQGPIAAQLSALSRETHVTLIGGGVPQTSPDASRPYNSCVVFGPDGQLKAVYRKLHLFDVTLPDGTQYLESAAVRAGDDVVCVDVESISVGLSICYDLRFGELYRALVDRGAEVLVVPAAFTLQTGKEHWHALLKARAIECQCWVLAAGQRGSHPEGRKTYGHSLVVDPWGTIVAEASDRVGFVLAEIDTGYTRQVRERLPSLKHRRL